MSRYEGRHSARHAAPRVPLRTQALRALRSPVVAAPVAVAVVGIGAGAVAASGTPGSAEAAVQAAGSVAQVAPVRAASAPPAALLVREEAVASRSEQVRSMAAARVVAEREAAAARTRAAARAKAVATAKAAAKAKADAEAKAAAKAKADAKARHAALLASRDPQDIARAKLADRGWGEDQMSCLVQLWTKESSWDYRATNSSSGAYGIPQSLPGDKMATVAHDWRTNPATQIEWGLRYIKSTYGTPCGAWGHSQSYNWY